MAAPPPLPAAFDFASFHPDTRSAVGDGDFGVVCVCRVSGFVGGFGMVLLWGSLSRVSKPFDCNCQGEEGLLSLVICASESRSTRFVDRGGYIDASE